MADTTIPKFPVAGKCPLSEEDCAKINQILQECHDLDCAYRKLAELGMDVNERLATNNSVSAFLNGIKAHFFPHHP